MALSELWEQAKPWMAKRSGHAGNGGLEGRSERLARGHRQPRLATDECQRLDALGTMKRRFLGANDHVA